eukprot:gnl/MRDRNA2_/MRDRNA2_146399_c0_seq1.p1 gnl/MRDRNA2_/MRDRNA2_146399_c0~~gnl/MRDRNA2_/MRDRNA2_146399_c0_seq1.p1  ORF type:complete len:298 (+),score=59.64 gnl/MRDRNA2_/MRDRNA2_146399_c0_seq1:106-894(+)
MAANTVICQSQCIFVYGLSICLLGERLERNKVLGVILAIGGVALIVSQKEKEKGVHENAICYFWCLVNNCLYAFFVVLYDRFYVGKAPQQGNVETNGEGSFVSDENALFEHESVTPKNGIKFSLGDVVLALGLRGLVVFLITGPVLGFLNWTGLEKLQAPEESETWTFFTITLMDWMFNAGFLLGIVVLSGLWVTVGLVLVVPAGLITDVVLHDLRVTNLAILGAFFVIAAFFLVNIPSKEPEDDGEDEAEDDEEDDYIEEF